MRTIRMTRALVCLLTGAALTGCAAGDGGEGKSAADLLHEANDTMRALRSVTVEMTNTAANGTVTTRLETDLKNRCRAKTTWAEHGSLEQIRIGGTDYVRPDETYLGNWSGRKIDGLRLKQWVKEPADQAQPGDGLAACTWTFASFGKAEKGKTTRIGDRKAVALKVTDKADKGGTYTFYVATEGKPYLLRTVYEGGGNLTTTSFSAFDEPLDVQPPASVGVLESGDVGG
ncbi:outer membrane lipoprotein carrier protein LolA [Streptomyces sp. NPDC053069]|uniref:outer membrane lipoprotein carrier protein LolA n=1 Tax=Streptomyces sp. NPDC053069 TaxID=3365695 RepID=UPI0037D01F49